MSSKDKYLDICQRVGAALNAPAHHHVQLIMFLAGIGLLVAGFASNGLAQIPGESEINYNTERMDTALNVIFGYIEGSFGALIMVASGLGAIMSSAFGQYRAALGCLIVAVGSFILRSVVSTFFSVELE